MFSLQEMIQEMRYSGTEKCYLQSVGGEDRGSCSLVLRMKPAQQVDRLKNWIMIAKIPNHFFKDF